MINILREIDTPDKNYTLVACDFVLLPVNTLLGKRKVVRDGNTWRKEERTTSIALIVLAYIGTIVFAPVIATALLIKAGSAKHRQMSKWYHREKKEAYFRERGYVIKDVNRRDKESFAFHLEKRTIHPTNSTPSFWVEFTCFGKLKYRKLFEQLI